jgi:predicted secreted protein
MPVIVPLELTVNDVNVPTDVRLEATIVGERVVVLESSAYELKLDVVAYELSAEVSEDEVTYELSVEVNEVVDTLVLSPLFTDAVVA